VGLGWRRLNWEAWGKVFIPWRERWGIVGYERRGFEGIKRMVGEQKTKGKVIHNWGVGVLTKIAILSKVNDRKRAGDSGS